MIQQKKKDITGQVAGATMLGCIGLILVMGLIEWSGFHIPHSEEIAAWAFVMLISMICYVGLFYKGGKSGKQR